MNITGHASHEACELKHFEQDFRMLRQVSRLA